MFQVVDTEQNSAGTRFSGVCVTSFCRKQKKGFKNDLAGSPSSSSSSSSSSPLSLSLSAPSFLPL